MAEVRNGAMEMYEKLARLDRVWPVNLLRAISLSTYPTLLRPVLAHSLPFFFFHSVTVPSVLPPSSAEPAPRPGKKRWVKRPRSTD